jgi:Protein of unknown function (DUF3568)
MHGPSARRPLTRIALLLVAALALASSGCLLVAAGAAGGAAVGYAYCKGKVCGAYNAGFEDTWAAVRTALGELGMAIRTEQHEGASGTITTRTNDAERVHIQVDQLAGRIPAEPVLTRVCIRVAAFGDRQVSERILDQVGYHLTPAPLAQAAIAQPAGPGVVQTGTSTPPPPPAPPANAAPAQTAPPPVLPVQPEPIRH